MNPNAVDKLQKPLTESDYLNSKYVSEPLRMLDSVMVCDGANGVLVTSTETANQLGAKQMIPPVGYGEISNFKGAEPLADSRLSGFSVAVPRPLKQAELPPTATPLISHLCLHAALPLS